MKNPMRILVRLVLNWKCLERISRCCASLPALGCTYVYDIYLSCLFIYRSLLIFIYRSLLTYLYVWHIFVVPRGRLGHIRARIYVTRGPHIWKKNPKPNGPSREADCRLKSNLSRNSPSREERESNILQHTATHCNTLQHAVWNYITLRWTATGCNTPQLFLVPERCQFFVAC